MQRRWAVLSIVACVALFALHGQRNAAVRWQQPRKKGCEEIECADSTGLPPASSRSGELASMCAQPEFVHAALNATIVVFAWRRLESIRRLLRSLRDAERAGLSEKYCRMRVPLVIMADAGADEDVVAYARGFNWTHGPMTLTLHEGQPLGIRGMWIRMFRTHSDRNLLPFEDDIEVSPLFWWWLVRAVREYGPLESDAQVRAKQLAGIALYTPRLNEIQYPQVHWRPSREGGVRAHALLLQVPCSWGALFFSAYIADFLRFYDVRSQPPFYDFADEARQTGAGKDRQALGDSRVRLPNARCNTWARSWKRFLIDFMFGRGLVMLYPSFDGEHCFATTYMERGGHSGKDGKVETISLSQLRRDLDPYKTPPLALPGAFEHMRRQLDSRTGLPSWERLPVFSVHHNRRDHLGVLAATGRSFLAKVRQRGAETNVAPLYDRLVALWGDPHAPETPAAAAGAHSLSVT